MIDLTEAEKFDKFREFSKRLDEMSHELADIVRLQVQKCGANREVIALCELLRLYGERNLTNFKENARNNDELQMIIAVQKLVRNESNEVEEKIFKK